MNRRVLLPVFLHLAVHGDAQTQCNYAGVACQSGAHVACQVAGVNVFAPQDLPVFVDCEFFLNNVSIGSTSGWLDELGPVFEWAMAIPPAYEGQVFNVQGDWSISSGPGPSEINDVCSGGLRYFDLVENGMFTWSTQVADCAAGTFRVVLADDASEPGNVTLNNRAAAINYQLMRDGAVVASGPLSNIYVSGASAFVLDGLTTGNHVLTLTGAETTDNIMCGSATWTFTVPQAGDCAISLALTAALQGPSVQGSTLMSDALRSGGLLPLTEPYSALGYTYTGTAPNGAAAPALFTVTGNDAVVDWLIVELRSASDPSVVLNSQQALLQRDRDIIGLNGRRYLTFPQAPGNYHVAIRHRNHLGIRTGALQALGPISLKLDLATVNTAVSGNDPRVSVTGGRALWAGDATGNGMLKYTGSANDRDPILLAVGSTTPNATVTNVYDRRDTNLDGVIKYTGTANDRDIILTNVGSTAPNNTRTQQLP